MGKGQTSSDGPAMSSAGALKDWSLHYSFAKEAESIRLVVNDLLKATGSSAVLLSYGRGGAFDRADLEQDPAYPCGFFPYSLRIKTSWDDRQTFKDVVSLQAGDDEDKVAERVFQACLNNPYARL